MEYYKELLSYFKKNAGRADVQKHSINLSWMFFARIGNMAITFLATAYIARHLGPTNYGQLSYSISFVGLFSFIASLGLDQILHRDLIRFPDKKNELLGSSIAIRSFASVCTTCIVMICAFLMPSKDVSLLLIFIISLSPIFGTFQLLGYEFQAETKSKYPSILSFSIIAFLNVLKIITVAYSGGVIYLALIILLEPVLYSVGYIYLKQKFYHDFKKLTFKKNTAFLLVKESFPLIFASAFYLIYSRIDQVMIKNMLGAESVGLYDAAVRISELSYFVPSIILVAVFPAIISAKEVSSELYYKRMKKLLFLLLFIATTIAAVTAFFSKQLLMLIYGGSFIGGLSVLQIYVWGNIGAALNVFAQQTLIAEHLTKNITFITFIGMATNVILNILFIPMYGMEGAALATLISYMMPFISLILLKSTRIIILNIIRA